MTFLSSFRILYDHGQLFCFMTMVFLSQRFCLSVRILTVFSCEIFDKEWVILPDLGVAVATEFCGNKSLAEGRFVRSSRLSNFLAGEILFSLGCEFKNIKARYSSF